MSNQSESIAAMRVGSAASTPDRQIQEEAEWRTQSDRRGSGAAGGVRTIQEGINLRGQRKYKGIIERRMTVAAPLLGSTPDKELLYTELNQLYD